MYNRYIPQSDGTYKKNRLNEPDAPFQPVFSPEPACTAAGESIQPLHSPGNIHSFFRNLLPENLDTEDLIIILLLLLLSESKNGDSNSAMLTLGAYLFL